MSQNLLDAFSPAILACALSTAGEKSLGGIFQKPEENKENFRSEEAMGAFSLFKNRCDFWRFFFPQRLCFFLVKLKPQALELLNTYIK